MTPIHVYDQNIMGIQLNDIASTTILSLFMKWHTHKLSSANCVRACVRDRERERERENDNENVRCTEWNQDTYMESRVIMLTISSPIPLVCAIDYSFLYRRCKSLGFCEWQRWLQYMYMSKILWEFNWMILLLPLYYTILSYYYIIMPSTTSSASDGSLIFKPKLISNQF